jgi:L-iditol 2-dehydrogenase
VYRGQRKTGVKTGLSVLVIEEADLKSPAYQLAKTLGASLVVAADIVPYRLEAARRFGADEAVSAGEKLPDIFRGISKGRPADIVVLTTGAENAISQAFQSVDRGGTILFFAPSKEGIKIPVPVNELFWRNEITLTSSYAANYNEHMTAMEFIRQKKVNVRHYTNRLWQIAKKASV